jgi:exocyst complex component 2
LEPDDVQNLRSGAVDLVNLIRESVFSFFSDPPVEDLSDLYSPIPPTPITPAPDSGRDGNTSASALTPLGKRAFSFDPNNLPPPSPKRGDPWEKFAFWPPQANSLSGSHHLARLLALIGTACADLASLPIVKQTRSVEPLKILVGAVRERCIQAITAAWTTDAERCKHLETWTRSPERRDLTLMPASFSAFEEKVVQNAQKIAYVSDASSVAAARPGSASAGTEVVVPPPTKLLQSLRGTFVTSLYKALSGMVENAEKSKAGSVDETDPDGVTVAARAAGVGEGGEAVGDAGNRVGLSTHILRFDIIADTCLDTQNIRMLLTLSNLTHLRIDLIPHLITTFETAFSVSLTDETKTIRDVLSQIDTRLFQSYVKPTVETLNKIISDGVTSPNWVPKSTQQRPTDAKPYVYDVLLALVLVHSEVSSTAPTLTSQILSYLLEQASLALINAFKTRPKYSLPALMQATLDVEFMAQTLNSFTTDRAGEVQSQIYLALDERTDNEARARLQSELPEMRAVLKRLREGTKGEFGCFKKERRGREGRSGTVKSG